MILELIDYKTNELAAKFTVEELSGFKYISTEWNTSQYDEFDRAVTEFETYSAALAHAYENALHFSLSYDGELYAEEE